MSFIMRALTLVAAVTLIAGGAFGQCADCNDSPAICAAGSPWYKANETKLRVSTPNSSDYTQYKYVMPDGNSFSVDFESKSEGRSQTGRILLVGGRVMLTRDFSPSRGYEIDALDLPVLTYQLAVTLLGQSFPAGPHKLDRKRVIDLAEQKRGIKVATVSAGGCYLPPWKLKGHMQRRDSETTEFSLRFFYNGDGGEQAMLIDGELKRPAKSPQLDPSMSLEGWTLYTLGRVAIKQEGGTILDYGAQQQPKSLKTLGELQESLRMQDGRSKDRQ